jgi:hypothetical protein
LNPSTTLRLALVGSTSQQSPNCDPALDLTAPGAASRLSAYERSRSDADRDALPLAVRESVDRAMRLVGEADPRQQVARTGARGLIERERRM